MEWRKEKKEMQKWTDAHNTIVIKYIINCVKYSDNNMLITLLDYNSPKSIPSKHVTSLTLKQKSCKYNFK